MKNIGQIIATQRKKLNISQAELAEKLKVSKSYMCKLENGNTPLSLKRLSQIGEILNVDFFSNINEYNDLLTKWLPIIEILEDKGVKPEEILQLLNKFIGGEIK